MQRLPARTVALTGGSKQSAGGSGGSDRRAEDRTGISPVKLLAMRISEEQGPDQVKAFLSAMIPFAAPNELKFIGSEFGISSESFLSDGKKQSPGSSAAAKDGVRVDENKSNNGSNAVYPAQAQKNRQESGGANPSQQLQMLQKLMYLQGLMNGNGTDVSALVNMLKGK